MDRDCEKASGIVIVAGVDETEDPPQPGLARPRSWWVTLALVGVVVGTVRLVAGSLADPETASMDPAVTVPSPEADIPETPASADAESGPVATDGANDVVDVLVSNLNPTNGYIAGVVKADVGYLALVSGNSPTLWRSLDGVTWGELDTNLSRSGSVLKVTNLDGTLDLFEPYFDHLIRTPDGFAMIEIEIDLYDTEDRSGPPSTLRRWISDDGIQWRIDDTFDQRSSAAWQWPFYHDQDRVGVAEVSATQDSHAVLDELSMRWFLPESAERLTESICEWQRNSAATLVGYPCSSEERIMFTADDLVDPDVAAPLFQCVAALERYVTAEFTVLESAGMARTTTLPFSSTPVVLDDGRLIALDRVGLNMRSAGCDTFVEMPESDLVIASPGDGEPIRIPLPNGVEVGPQSFGQSIQSDGKGNVLVAIESELYSLDVATLNWTKSEMPPFDSPQRRVAPVQFVFNSTMVLGLAGKQLQWGRVGSELSELTLDRVVDVVDPHLLDDERLLFRTPAGHLAVIELPAG